MTKPGSPTAAQHSKHQTKGTAKKHGSPSP